MTDRIREAVFDILASRYAARGALPPFAVADLFAGSGCLGLEAVSRGADACDFFEKGTPAIITLRNNLVDLRAGPNCRLNRADAWTAPLATPRPPRPYGLIFVDPPYRDAQDVTPQGRVPLLLADLFRARWADADTMIVLHHERRVDYPHHGRATWKVHDRRVYGKAAVTFIMQRPDDPSNDPSNDPPDDTSNDPPDDPFVDSSNDPPDDTSNDPSNDPPDDPSNDPSDDTSNDPSDAGDRTKPSPPPLTKGGLGGVQPTPTG